MVCSVWPAPREQCVSPPAQLQQLFPHHPPPLDNVFFLQCFGFPAPSLANYSPPIPFPMQCIFALHLFSQFVCVPPTCLPTILFLHTTFIEQVCPTRFLVPHYNLSFLVKGKTVFHPKKMGEIPSKRQGDNFIISFAPPTTIA